MIVWENGQFRNLPWKKIRPIALYGVLGLVICVLIWFQRDLDCLKELSAECEERDGVTEISPGFLLPEGDCLIDVHVIDSGDVPKAVIEFYSPEHGLIDSRDITNGIRVNTYEILFKERENKIHARIVYPEGTEGRIQVTGFTLWPGRPLYSDAGFVMALFIVLYLLFGVYYFGGRKPGKNWYYGAAVILAVLFSSYPLFSDYLTECHDLNFQLYRIEGIKDALLCGQFPARVHPTHLDGYGYATAALYPELFLYLPAILRIMGMSVVLSFKVFLFLINLATALVMYYAVKSITKSSYYSTLASVVYTVATYRVICVHERAAVGELLAMCFMPLVVSGIYHVFIGDKRKWPQLVIGATCVFQSHLIGTLLTAFLAVFLGLVYIRRLFSEHRLLYLLYSIDLILLLNLWFLVPFFDFYSLDLVQNHLSGGGNIFHDHVIIPAQLLNLFGDNYGLSYELSHGILGEMSQTLGLAVSACLLGGIVLFLVKKRGRDSFGLPLFLFGLVMLVCATSLVPWRKLEGIEAVNVLTTTLQFPWRFLGPVTLAVVMAMAVAGAREYPVLSVKTERLCLGILLGLGIYGCVAFGASATQNMPVYLEKAQAINLNSTIGMNQEYLLYGTDTEKLTRCLYTISQDGVQVLDKEKKGTTVTVDYANGLENAWIEVPLLWYPGYKAVDLSTGQELPVTIGENNVVRVTVPGLSEGTFRVYYAGRGRYRAAELVSMLTLASWAGISLWKRKKEKAADEVPDCPDDRAAVSERGEDETDC